jgi:hypothetical protein
VTLACRRISSAGTVAQLSTGPAPGGAGHVSDGAPASSRATVTVEKERKGVWERLRRARARPTGPGPNIITGMMITTASDSD